MKKKVIIIGAGPAGLTAAYELLKKSTNYSITILEESDTIGGISRTVNYKGNRMDIGGHRFFSKEKRVNDFWQNILPIQGKPSFDDKKLNRKKNLVKGGPDPEKEDKVFLVRNRVSRIYFLKKFFNYPISMKLQTFKNLGLVRTIKSGFSYLKSVLIKKKEDSLENFYINRFGKELYSTFFEKYTEKLWGRHPKQISADWGAQRVKGLSVLAVIKDAFSKIFHTKKKHQETSLIEEYLYPKLGPGQLWETVASEVEKMGGKILKKHKVIHINNDKEVIKSVTCLVNGKEKEIKGDIFISSMPLKDLVINMDKVPKDIYKIADGLPYRDFVTIGVLVKKLNLKNETKIKTLNNIVPDCWIYIQEPDVKLGRIQIFNNWSPYMVKKAMDTVWIGLEYFCNENDKFWRLSDQEASDFAINELVKMGIVDKKDVLDTHREKVKKAYPAYFDTYAEIDKVIAYLNHYSNLFCVGRNGQHRYNNMDHSMMTAMKTVDNILDENNAKDDIWNVNTEQEFHEEDKKNNKFKKTVHKIQSKLSQIKINKWVALILLIATPLLWWFLNDWFLDNDSWFLLNHGRYVLEHGLPTIEPFTMHENLKFVMQQWLFSVGFYTLYSKLGITGVFIALILVNYLLLYIIYKICMLVSDNNYILSTIMSILIDLLLLNNLCISTRPQIFSYILLALEIYIIEKFRKNGNYKLLFILPIISIILINVHASLWWFMFIFMLPFIAEGFLETVIFKKKNVYHFSWLIIICPFIFLAGFINPYGLDAICYFINSYGGRAAEIIVEMRPIRVFSVAGKYVLGMMFIYFIIFMINYNKNKEVNISYLLMLFGCTILSFMAQKGYAFFVMFVTYPLCYFLKDLFRNNCLSKPTIIPKNNLGKISIVLFYVLLGGLSWYLGKKIIDGQNELYYKDGVDKLLEVYNPKDMKVYTNYDIGGYLEWRGIKTFIDPRAEVFYLTMNHKMDIFGDYVDIQMGNGSIADFVKAYDFTHLFVVSYDRLYTYDNFKDYDLFYEKENYYKIYVKKDYVNK